MPDVVVPLPGDLPPPARTPPVHLHVAGRRVQPGSRVLVTGPAFPAAIVADVIWRLAGRRRLPVTVHAEAPPPGARWNLRWTDAAPAPNTAAVPSPADAAAAGIPSAGTVEVHVAPLHEPAGTGLDARLGALRRSADGRTLAELRNEVARWAQSPSNAPDERWLAQIMTPLADLAAVDTVAALSAYDRMAADPHLPPGTKFETAALADHVLGLDLTAALR
jgi:hypothetical protein